MPFPLQRTLDPIIEPVSLESMKNYLRVDDFLTQDDDLISGLISASRERAEDMTARCLIAQEWTFCMDHFPSWYGHESGGYFFGEHRHPRHHSMFRSDNLAIILPRGPVLSVESITWKDFSGAVNTLDPSLYDVDLLSEPARIRPLYNGCWPFAMWDTNSVVIKFIAGYQQTVTETLTVSATAPYTATISRLATFLSLTSVTDVVSKLAVPNVVIEPSTGVITVPEAEAGLQVSVVYQVSSIPKSFIRAIYLMCGSWYENRAEVIQGGGNFNSLPTPMSATSLLGTYQLFPLGYPKS
jgi:hypothetical protein